MKKRLIVLALILVGVITCTFLSACTNKGFEVKFMVDGEVHATVKTSGEEEITLPTAPQKDGFDFDGWYRDKDVWQVPFKADSLLNEKLTENLTVYAKFVEQVPEAEKFTVTYNANGGKFTGDKDTYLVSDVTDGTRLTALTGDALPTRSGYVFKGWAKNADGSGAWNFASDTVTENTTLYAVWEADVVAAQQYTVTLDADGGELDSTTVKVTADQNFELLVPTKTGYTFGGWYDGETQITGADGRSLAPYNFDADKTFTAKWTIATYSVAVETEGGTAPSNVISIAGEDTFNYGDSVTLTATLNLGYIFDGWYLGDDDLLSSELEYTFTMPANNVVYVAKYHLDERLNGFSFTSTATTCAITGITGNKAAIEEIEIPDYVTSISASILNGCSSLISLTVPFIGNDIERAEIFGWLFGTDQYDNSKGINLVYGEDTYYIPLSLREVTVLGGEIAERAFESCTMLRKAVIGDGVEVVGGAAFYGCTGLMSVTIGKNVSEFGAYQRNQYTTYYTFDGCTKLYEVYNFSSFVIEAGVADRDSGNVGANAWDVYTTAEPSKIGIVDDFLFYAGETVILLGYEGTPDVLTLPDDYDGREYEIGTRAFYGISTLTSVTFGAKVTKIGDYAFAGGSGSDSSSQSNLTEVNLNEGLITIGNSAFSGCGKLTSIVIPNTVITIGNSAFYDGSMSSMSGDKNNLANLTIGDHVETIGDSAFKFTKIVDLVIPDSVISIGSNAFAGDSFDSFFGSVRPMKTVRLGRGLTTVGADAFGYLTNIERVDYSGTLAQWFNIEFKQQWSGPLSNPTYYSGNLYIDGKNVFEGELEIPEDVTVIPSGMFAGSAITSVTFPDGLLEIGATAFQNCKNLVSITIPSSVTTLGNSVFYGCSALTAIDFGSLTSIPDSAFRGCTGLTKLTIPDTITSLGGYAFADCTGLTAVVIGTGVAEITGWGTFSGCTNILEVWNLSSLDIQPGSSECGGVAQYALAVYTDINTPSALDEQNNYTFIETSDKVYLLGYTGTAAELTLPNYYNGNKAYYIRSYAFANRSDITKITIPDTVLGIEEYAFQNNTGLTEIKLPIGLTSIGGYIFSGCSSLTTVNLSALTSLKSIGKEAFSKTGLVSVTLPAGLESIESMAFYQCNSLESITLPEGLTKIGDSAFQNTGLTSITIPNSVTAIEKYTFSNCANLTTVNIGSGVTKIGNQAFSSCSALTSVTLNDVLTEIGSNAFYYCSSLTGKMTLPASLQKIGSAAFSSCGLTEIEFKDPSGWATFNGYGDMDHVFDDLDDPTVAAGYLTPSQWAGDYTNSDWAKYQEVVVGDFKFQIIGAEAKLYEYTGSATEIVLPEYVTVDGKQIKYTLGKAFSGSNITKITISVGVNKISAGAFSDCESLTEIVMAVTEGWMIESYYTEIPSEVLSDPDELIANLVGYGDYSNMYSDWTLKAD